MPRLFQHRLLGRQACRRADISGKPLILNFLLRIVLKQRKMREKQRSWSIPSPTRCTWAIIITILVKTQTGPWNDFQRFHKRLTRQFSQANRTDRWPGDRSENEDEEGEFSILPGLPHSPAGPGTGITGWQKPLLNCCQLAWKNNKNGQLKIFFEQFRDWYWKWQALWKMTK